MSIYLQYAVNFGCTIQNAIADRDWPLNREQCIEAFLDASGRLPTEDEIREMRPNDQDVIDDFCSDWG